MIDLHTHTQHSDGADDVRTLLCQAERLKLTVLSITDHNTAAAYREMMANEWNSVPEVGPAADRPDAAAPALNPASLYSGLLIPGVEITCMYRGEVVEVLGYGYRLKAMEEELSCHVLTFEEKQKREYQLLCGAFRRAGVSFDPEEVIFDPKKESCRKSFLRHLKTVPENRRFFGSEESWESSKAFTRQEIYNPESRLYADEAPLYPDIRTAVEMIHNSGGIAFLAHLYIYAHASEFREELLKIVRGFGLDGVECAHSSFSLEQIADLEEFCGEHGFLKSGGSDYHGSRKPGVMPGSGRGQLCIPETYLKDWPEEIRYREL